MKAVTPTDREAAEYWALARCSAYESTEQPDDKTPRTLRSAGLKLRHMNPWEGPLVYYMPIQGRQGSLRSVASYFADNPYRVEKFF